jgi:hypothetical protein
LSKQCLENFLHLPIDEHSPLAGAPLQATLDRQFTTDARILERLGRETDAVRHEHQHFVAADSRVPGQDRSRTQGFFGRHDPGNVVSRAEDIIGFTFRTLVAAVLLDDRDLVD